MSSGRLRGGAEYDQSEINTRSYKNLLLLLLTRSGVLDGARMFLFAVIIIKYAFYEDYHHVAGS